MDLYKFVYVIRAIGLDGIYHALQYAYLRDRLDRKAKPKIASQEWIPPGKIRLVNPTEGGVDIKFDRAELEIIYLTQNMVRISWSPGKPPSDYAMTKSPSDRVPAVITINDDQYIVSAKELKIAVSHNGEISILNSNGSMMKRDLPPQRYNDTWKLSTPLSLEEHIYGLGERAAKLDLRNGSYISWNTDAGGSYSRGADPLYIGTPIYLSANANGSYLVYFENTHRSTFKIGDTLDASFSGGMLRYYFITGTLETIYAELSSLLGTPDLPPKWSLGYHQCRWGYRSEEDIRRVVAGFEDHDFPLSAIHLDIDYMDQFEVFSTHPKRFPAMKALTSDLGKKGIRVVTSINPAVKIDPDFQVYTSGIEQDIFCKFSNGELVKGVSWPGWSMFPDFTNPKAREWWKQQYKSLIDDGVAGIWHDMNEPSSFAAWGDKTLPATTIHNMDGRGGSHLEAHNIYGLLMNQAGYDALLEFAPAKRPWIFSRAGWAGSQRYAWNWTGDTESSWEELRQTVPTIIGLGLSGHAFSGVDIGGFDGNPDAELYLRWFQMATFFPLFRTHSAVGTKPREPWSFGEPTTSFVRKFARLRYELLQHIYTIAWETSQAGALFIRPVFWNNPNEPTLWDIEDEFLLGEKLLIAPVIYPSESHRSVTLPPGYWYSFWDDQLFEGPCEIDCPTPLESIPIFVKGGTILPTLIKEAISFHVYLSNENTLSNQIYFDDGDGYGPFRIDSLELTTSLDKAWITWNSEGQLPFPYPRVRFVIHGAILKGVIIDGDNQNPDGNSFTAHRFHSAELTID